VFSWVTLGHLAKWTGGQWVGNPALESKVESLSTDSRALKKGEVFLALKGPSFDGHEFIRSAASLGALAAVVEKADSSATLPQLVVKDSLRALVAIGEGLRDSFSGPVLGITGSAGKSSTKEMVADLLGANAVRSPKSFNNILGVPRTLCLVNDQTTALVLEVGMNALGEIKEICRHFKPTRGLITNIGEAHIGKLGGQEFIYQAKKELFDALASRPQSEVALNVDDPLVVQAYSAAFSKKPETVTYSGLGAKADVSVLERRMDPQTGALTLRLNIRGTEATIPFSLFGLHQAANIAAASSAALLFGLSPKEILERLPQLKSTSQRGELIGLSESRTLIDESYNSNPSALISSLASVAELDPARRRLLVLGEMRELDAFSDALHAKAGKALVALYQAKRFPFLLVGVGNGFLPFLAEVERALPGVPCIAVPDTAHAIERLRSLVMPSDIILVKGSRGIALESIVAWLKSDH
jgi:UDP-N-acetylmuramoyl-tripeptide--D-alanyl-D-alanine ligase